MEVLVETRNLKSYYVLNVFGNIKTVKAVDDVNIRIMKDEIYGIAGESGCGKSTLLKTLFGDVEPPLRVIDGGVFYHDGGKEHNIYEDGGHLTRQFRWKFISYVPQGSMSVLNPVVKVKEVFKDFLDSHLKSESKKEAFDIAVQHLRELGLPDNVLNAYSHQLSGGMRQRVAIALSTVLSPKVIIADEPTTALDVVTQRGVIQLLKDIQEKYKNTIVIVTHDMGVHANIATRVAIMYAGKIVEESSTEKIFGEPQHPYTRYLINSLPSFENREKRTSAPGNPPSLSELPSGCSFHPRCPYRMKRCESEVPLLRDYGDDHSVACWLMEEK